MKPERDVIATALKIGDKIMHAGKVETVKLVDKTTYIESVPRVRVFLVSGNIVVFNVSKKVTVYE